MGLILRLTKFGPRINPVYNAHSTLVSTDSLILNRSFVVASVAGSLPYELLL